MGYRTERYGLATISLGNTKLGTIPNVSTCPGRDCGDVPCRKKCYAHKALRQYKEVRNCWRRNSTNAKRNLDGFMEGVRDYLCDRSPKWFRWHVAGDIHSQLYLDEMIAIAREYPDTKFLCFTKRHDMTYRKLPSNLSIVFSMWPGWGDARKARNRGLPIAWMQDGKETRIPDDAIECPGHCDSCGMCWNLKKIGRDVYFPVH